MFFREISVSLKLGLMCAEIQTLNFHWNFINAFCNFKGWILMKRKNDAKKAHVFSNFMKLKFHGHLKFYQTHEIIKMHNPIPPSRPSVYNDRTMRKVEFLAFLQRNFKIFLKLRLRHMDFRPKAASPHAAFNTRRIIESCVLDAAFNKSRHQI